MKTLIVCDLQPDVVQKLQPPKPRQFVDLCHLAVQACRQSHTTNSDDGIRILFLMLHFDQPGYTQIEPSHPKLGILRRLAKAKAAAASSNLTLMKQPNWLTSKTLSIPTVAAAQVKDDGDNNNNNNQNNNHDDDKENDSISRKRTIMTSTQEKVLTRTTFLPQANDIELLKTLSQRSSAEEGGEEFIVIGYGPTVQSICNLLGDVMAIAKVQIVQECVFDEIHKRCRSFLQHGLLFGEEVISLVDFLESLDLLQERIDFIVDADDTNNNCNRVTTTTTTTNDNGGEGSLFRSYQAPPPVKYVSDCGRGGHLTLFLPYLLRDHGYCLWPTQPWYQSLSLGGNKEYRCPVGRQMVDLCDEPQFSLGTKFFLSGRQHLDAKNLLNDLVPEIMPPTFDSIEAAKDYLQQQQQQQQQNGSMDTIWFLKKVNQNGGRAVIVTNELPTSLLEEDDQLQIHVPRPLLWQTKYKFHVKTYQYIACTTSVNNANDNDHPSTGSNNASSTTKINWEMYMHDLFYLAVASRPWNPNDLSEEAQITTMRTHRLYPDNPLRVQWKLTELCRANMRTVLERAVEQGKLRSEHVTVTNKNNNNNKYEADYKEEMARQQQQQQQALSSSSTLLGAATLQFEVNSADWMLDEDGRIYLIECNGIPVLYDGGMPQDLVTKGLQLYDRLYKENPETAVVNDHDLIQEAIGLAATGKLPNTSLWKHVATIPGKD